MTSSKRSPTAWNLPIGGSRFSNALGVKTRDPRAVHLRPRRQPAGRAGAGIAELLVGLRGHGRVQPGRRHGAGAGAMDGRGRTVERDTCSALGCRPLRSMDCTPSYTRSQGASRIIRCRFQRVLPERGIARRRGPSAYDPYAYDHLASDQNAVFGRACTGMEHVNYFAPPGEEHATRSPSFRRSNAFPATSGCGSSDAVRSARRPQRGA